MQIELVTGRLYIYLRLLYLSSCSLGLSWLTRASTGRSQGKFCEDSEGSALKKSSTALNDSPLWPSSPLVMAIR